MKKVGAAMAFYPAMEQVSDGTCLRYLISGESAGRFYVLEILPDRMSLTLNCTTSPYYYYKEIALRFLSVAMALADDYRIDLYYVLANLIGALAGGTADASAQKPNFNREADIFLSKRVIELSRANKEAALQISALEADCSSLLASAIAMKYNGTFTLDNVSSDLKVSKQRVVSALEALWGKGYRVVVHKSGAYELIGF